ncbi:hypothetical protein EOPP23_06910 [Endozoicomonas sp. OPT23]|uniref:hypothetical protein n=1 Tax=Endozoicomonas sp. OPT23 TaxID=2072845 RepID=UPI00129B2377|nr:hypothetical protein [Endozoicomonas sp. OPT23]MRI32716.1 hypothetical protein [Endozoicomonas sp. OPT23]
MLRLKICSLLALTLCISVFASDDYPKNDAILGPCYVYASQPLIRCAQPYTSNTLPVFNSDNCYLGSHYLFHNRLPEHARNDLAINICSSGCSPGLIADGRASKRALLINSRQVAIEDSEENFGRHSQFVGVGNRDTVIEEVDTFVYNLYVNVAYDEIGFTLFPVFGTRFPNNEEPFTDKHSYLSAIADDRQNYTSMILDAVSQPGEMREIELQLAQHAYYYDRLVSVLHGKQLDAALSNPESVMALLLPCALGASGSGSVSAEVASSGSDSSSGFQPCPDIVLGDYSGSGSASDSASGSTDEPYVMVIPPQTLLSGLDRKEGRVRLVTTKPLIVSGTMQLENLVWIFDSQLPAIILKEGAVLTSHDVEWATQVFPVEKISQTTNSLYLASHTNFTGALTTAQYEKLPCLALESCNYSDMASLGLTNTYLVHYQTNCQKCQIDKLQAGLIYAPGVDLFACTAPPAANLANTLFLETPYSNSTYFYTDGMASEPENDTVPQTDPCPVSITTSLANLVTTLTQSYSQSTASSFIAKSSVSASVYSNSRSLSSTTLQIKGTTLVVIVTDTEGVPGSTQTEPEPSMKLDSPDAEYGWFAVIPVAVVATVVVVSVVIVGCKYLRGSGGQLNVPAGSVEMTEL